MFVWPCLSLFGFYYIMTSFEHRILFFLFEKDLKLCFVELWASFIAFERIIQISQVRD